MKNYEITNDQNYQSCIKSDKILNMYISVCFVYDIY